MQTTRAGDAGSWKCCKGATKDLDVDWSFLQQTGGLWDTFALSRIKLATLALKVYKHSGRLRPALLRLSLSPHYLADFTGHIQVKLRENSVCSYVGKVSLYTSMRQWPGVQTSNIHQSSHLSLFLLIVSAALPKTWKKKSHGTVQKCPKQAKKLRADPR